MCVSLFLFFLNKQGATCDGIIRCRVCWLVVNILSPEDTTTAPGVSLNKREEKSFQVSKHPGVHLCVVCVCV